MDKVNTKQIIVFLLVASFFLSCSKNIQTTKLPVDQEPAKKITTPQKSLDEFLENQKLSSKLDPEDVFVEEAFELYKEAKKSTKYSNFFEISGTNDSKSIELLEQAVAKDPYYHAAHYVLGLCYSEIGNYKRAEECFLRSIKLKPKYQGGYTYLANIFKKQNRLDEALYYYDESLKAGPPGGAIFSNIGETYLLKGDLEKAETFYLEILKLETDKKFYLQDIADFYLKKGNLKESWRYLKESYTYCQDENYKKRLESYKQYLLESNFYAHASAGYIYYSCEEFKNAIEHFEKALELNRNEFDQYYLLGMSYRENNNYEKVVLYLEEALKIDPNHYDANLQLGIIYGYSEVVANYLKTKINYNRSIELLEKANRINPENQRPYLYLGKTYLEMKKYYDALRETRKALDIEEDSTTLNQMGQIYHELKDHKMALEYYNKSLEVYEDFLVRLSIIDTLMMLKKYDEVILFIGKSIDIYPKAASFNQKLGDLYFEKKEYQAAILHYEDCLKKDPMNLYAHFNVALSNLRLEKYDESEWWWKKTIEMNPKESGAFYNLGLVYLIKSKYEDAINNFNKFLELNPNSSDASEMIAICQYQIDVGKLPEKLRKLSLQNDNIGNLSSVLLCTFHYDDANDLWIGGVNETEYKDGQNIVSPKIFEAQGRFEKIKSDLEKISSPKGQTKTIVDSFLFAVNQRIKGIEQHSEGYYTKRGDYKGQFEKGRAKIRIADNYYVDCLKSLRNEITNSKSIFGDIAIERLKSSIKYYENQGK